MVKLADISKGNNSDDDNYTAEFLNIEFAEEEKETIITMTS